MVCLFVLGEFGPEAPPLLTSPSFTERAWLGLEELINLFLLESWSSASQL